MRKILIVCPSYNGHICVETIQSISDVMDFDFQKENELEVTFSVSPNLPVTLARNKGILQNQPYTKKWQFDFDALLSIDADMQFTKKNFLDILHVSKNTVYGGVYLNRSNESEKANKFIVAQDQWPWIGKSEITLNDLFYVSTKKVVWCGAGFLYIPKQVLDKIGFPWFSHEVVTYKGQSFELGDDLSFCYKCEKKKIPIYLDTTVRINHIFKGAIKWPESQPV